jgi:hypothetical protein
MKTVAEKKFGRLGLGRKHQFIEQAPLNIRTCFL